MTFEKLELCGGRAVIYRGDCREVLPTLADGSIDAIVTDPPYSSGGFTRGDRNAPTRTKYQSSDVKTAFASFAGDNRDQRSWVAWCSLWLEEARRACKPGAMLCMFIDWRQLPCATDAIQAGGWVWRGVVPWDKVQARPNPGRFRAQCEYVVWATNGPRDFKPEDDSVYGVGILRHATEPSADRDHATQKPVALMRDIIEVASPVGGTVLDVFFGSGATAEACIESGRNFIGVEIDEHYFEIARDRIARAEKPLTYQSPKVVDAPLFQADRVDP